MNNFDEIRSLFSCSDHLRFTIDAVIAGNSPGRIWVDNHNKPTVALLWDTYHCYYLGGTANNDQFNVDLKELLFDEIIPVVIEKNREIYKVEYSYKEWEPILEKILETKFPVKVARKFFILDTLLTRQWKEILPSNFKVRKIDKNLFESDIRYIERIRDEINECWYSVDDFLARGFGFCLIYSSKEMEEVQGWCTGEYFSEGKCGIGIETFQGYRRRGFATAMASAFVEHSLSINIQPYWDASADNHASVRVAEKVGFKQIQDYYVLFGTFK